MEDRLLTEMQSLYNNFLRAGIESVKLEELPPMIRAYIKSKYGNITGFPLSAFKTIIDEYKRELERGALPELVLSDEEKEAMKEAIEEVEKELRDPTKIGSDDYKEVVKELADTLKIFDDREIKAGLVADLLLKEFHFTTMADTEELYIYTKGVYRPWGEAFIKKILQDVFTGAGKLGRLTTHFVNEVINHIKRATLHYRSEFDKDKFIINVKNGLLDIRTLELKPHDPNYLSVIQLPVEWNPNVEYPLWDKFISEIVDEEDAKVLQEFIGYTLLRDCRFQKALMLTGSGANGKTTFLNVIIRMLGVENCSFRSLQELSTNRFAPADLFGKLANIYDDLPPDAIQSTGMFKILVSGGEIQAEKKFKNAFKFRNFAKLIFSANKVPTTYDDTRAFFRRWIIINFPHEFKEDKADPHLEEKLSTPEGLSYVLKWAVEGLKRLLEQGKFSYEEDIEKIEDMYLKASNPAYAFLTEMVEEDPDGAVTKDELYRAFIDYCKANKLPTMSKRTFGEQVKRWTRAADGWVKVEGRAVRAWRGIKLKSDGDDADKSKGGIDAWIGS